LNAKRRDNPLKIFFNLPDFLGKKSYQEVTMKKGAFWAFCGFLLITLSLAVPPSETWAAKKKFISMATTQSGTSWYMLGGAMCRVLNKNLTDLEATAEVTGGAAENNVLVQRKKTEIAWTTTSTAYWAHEGILDFTGNKCPDIRLILFGQTQYSHWFVLENSAIKTLADCKGKRVGVGQPGGANEMSARQMLEIYGLTANKDYKPLYLTYREQVDAMKDGNNDVCCQIAGIPQPAVLDIVFTHKIRFLEIDDAHFQMLVKKYPWYNRASIPANIYKNQTSPILTTGSITCLIVHKDMDADLVYRITKALLENNDYIKSVHPAGAEWGMSNQVMSHALTPIHPGALKYFKEKGLAK
jgi:hypothetical protein